VIIRTLTTDIFCFIVAVRLTEKETRDLSSPLRVIMHHQKSNKMETQIGK
jgi:hypothetical protein